MIFAITGGLGSFGSSLAKYLLANTPHSVRIIDRSEAKMEQFMALHSPSARLTYIIGDIRDRERLITAFYGADVVVHAAALKIVPLGEVHAQEFYKTNVIGVFNAIEAAIVNHATIRKFLFISSDKACAPLNGYGKSKAVGEWLVTAANLHSHGVRFASVRGGNVWRSRGSVIEKWLSSPDHNIKVYGPQSTRFHLMMPDWLEFCLKSIQNTHGGEVFVPKCDAWNLRDLADAFFEVFHDSKVEFLPPRHNEKSIETLISEHEFSSSIDLDWGYVIEPSDEVRQVWNYTAHEGKAINGAVSSDMVRRMTVDELRTLIVNENR